jgi:alkylhydroperoxidase family enzyme
MRIQPWSQNAHPQPADLVDAILARRGGKFIALDTALLWSEPLARGWNTYLKAVRTELPTSRKLRELGICTVALLTGAAYEYHHHAPDFLAAGGEQAQLDALQSYCPQTLSAFRAGQALFLPAPQGAAFSELEALVVQYAAQMTLAVQVQTSVTDALKQHFSTTELVELTAAIATYNMVARFLLALGINPEDELKGVA